MASVRTSVPLAVVQGSKSLQVRGQEWFVTQVVGDLLNRQVCKRAWVLGAGASVESQIPLASELAREWFCEILGIQDLDDGNNRAKFKEGLKARGFDEDLGLHYFDIYGERFHADRRAGHDALMKAIDGKSPSYGYFVLAELMKRSTSKIAITVNFDNLLADALHLMTRKHVQVIGHEKIAHCILWNWEVPIVCKIHRDLAMSPLNDREELSKLDDEWATVLTRMFTSYSPIFVGYAGNDQTLMQFLHGTDLKFPSGVPPIWLEFDPEIDLTKSNLPSQIQVFLASHGGVIVKHGGFDTLFKAIQARYLPRFDPAETFDVYSNYLKSNFSANVQQFAEVIARSTENENVCADITRHEPSSLDDYLTLAATVKNQDDRIDIYSSGVDALIESVLPGKQLAVSRLLNNIGHIFHSKGDYREAIAFFSEAIQHSPEYAKAIYNRACAYCMNKQDDKALTDLESAIHYEPERRTKAASDPDFSRLHKNPLFLNLTESDNQAGHKG
jgi:tetratricopeptide (TPR) repeat protein